MDSQKHAIKIQETPNDWLHIEQNTGTSNNKNPLVFDGGDTFHGTLPVLDSKGEVLSEILNSPDIKAMVGHWDFAYGKDQLLQLQSMLNYPVLGCNFITSQ